MGAANSGRFVWYDLMTTDASAAKPFYSEITGWKIGKSSDPTYEMWNVGETPIGGIMALSKEARQAGTPPHWLGYVATEDVNATAQKAQKLGGRVLVPTQEIPNVGRFAVLVDPQGAPFAVYTSATPERPLQPRELGHVGWAELNTTDWKAAWKFYSELFGWKKTSTMDMGPEFGEYFMFGMNSQDSLGGMSNSANMMKAPAHWMHYINVKNVDETAKRIAQKGGKILNGPMDVPGGDRIAQCADPQGGMFGIFSRAV